eukprot:2344635-Alexandrium_andersonii.AAC.1
MRRAWALHPSSGYLRDCLAVTPSARRGTSGSRCGASGLPMIRAPAEWSLGQPPECVAESPKD